MVTIKEISRNVGFCRKHRGFVECTNRACPHFVKEGGLKSLDEHPKNQRVAWDREAERKWVLR